MVEALPRFAALCHLAGWSPAFTLAKSNPSLTLFREGVTYCCFDEYENSLAHFLAAARGNLCLRGRVGHQRTFPTGN